MQSIIEILKLEEEEKENQKETLTKKTFFSLFFKI
jgi:hypothetical protein